MSVVGYVMMPVMTMKCTNGTLNLHRENSDNDLIVTLIVLGFFIMQNFIVGSFDFHTFVVVASNLQRFY